jgi:hypothetical protein
VFNSETLREAGLQPRHIHRLIGVSRVTASNWLRGKTSPHHLVKDRADGLMAAVQNAVDDGRLPVPSNLPPDERSVRTVAIVKKYMDAVNDAGDSPE